MAKRAEKRNKRTLRLDVADVRPPTRPIRDKLPVVSTKLRPEDKLLLDVLAFKLSRQAHARVTPARIIREAILRVLQLNPVTEADIRAFRMSDQEGEGPVEGLDLGWRLTGHHNKD